MIFILFACQSRAEKLWNQIQATCDQMDTASTELECFQALQKQEQLAASTRINYIWEEVQKQKELERTLQARYGNLTAEKERTQQLIQHYRIQEHAALCRALELAEAEKAAAAAAAAATNECSANADSALPDEKTLPVDPASEELPSHGTDTPHDQEVSRTPKLDIDESKPEPPSIDVAVTDNSEGTNSPKDYGKPPVEDPTDPTASSSPEPDVPEMVDEQKNTKDEEIVNEGNDTKAGNADGGDDMMVDEPKVVEENNSSEETTATPENAPQGPTDDDGNAQKDV